MIFLGILLEIIVAFVLFVIIITKEDADSKQTSKKVLLTIVSGVLIYCTILLPAVAKKNHIKELYEMSVTAYNNGEYVNCEDYLEDLLEIKPKHKKANNLLEEVKPLAKEEKISKLLSNAKIKRDEGDYMSAYDIALEILDIDPNNKEADSMRESLIEPANQQKIANEKEEQERKAAEEAERAERQKAEEAAKAEQEAKEKAEKEKLIAEINAAEEAKKKAEEKIAKDREQQIKQNAEATKQNFINNSLYVSSYDLLRNPNQYKNKPIHLEGNVTQTVSLQKGKLSSILESIGVAESSNYEMVILEDSDGEIALVYSPSQIGFRLLENDYLSVYGESKGITELTYTLFGSEGSYNVPEVLVWYVE